MMYTITFWALTLGCALGGFMVSMTWLGTKLPFLNPLHNMLKPFQTVIGFICCAAGVLAFFYPKGPEMLTGDLIPAVLALCLGFILAISYMPNRPQFVNTLNNMIRPLHVPIGIIAIIAAFVHWSFRGNAPFF
jgi:hypothetical protein